MQKISDRLWIIRDRLGRAWRTAWESCRPSAGTGT